MGHAKLKQALVHGFDTLHGSSPREHVHSEPGWEGQDPEIRHPLPNELPDEGRRRSPDNASADGDTATGRNQPGSIRHRHELALHCALPPEQ
jgi:hypothetical protein